MIIPISELHPDTLDAIIEAFILREGTDYGDVEATMQQKIEQVLQQLKSGAAVLVYSELHESVNIMSKQEFEHSPQEEQ